MAATPNPLIRWTPKPGSETRALVDGLRGFSPDGRKGAIEEGQAVLGKCVPPTVPEGDETGLVIGYVQSGKTLNFTTVSALARDNGYPLVIVITGTSINLFRQSTDRLIRDLGIGAPRGARKWRHFTNPKLREADSVRGALANWRSGNIPDARRQAVLITVMKHYRHLGNLNNLLEQLDLTGIPALVIDDEADQASMNNEVIEGEQSATYASLLQLKGRLPHHTFLQYTATPQAPLLINMIDALSPSWAEILEPGVDYVGGCEFFVPASPYVETIPIDQIPTKRRPLAKAPPTLLQAMRIFFLGAAYGLFRGETEGNRSMLVHPSRTRAPHGDYVTWINRASRRWGTVLSGDDEDAKVTLLNLFRRSYDDLCTTMPTLTEDAPFDELAALLPEAIRSTEVLEVNTRRGPTPQILWQNAYSHILVGGQSMDRGFTVEGLTVTYMPRNIGVGNADTIQQRARFFGYKRSYLGLCRIFLEAGTRQAYEEYVEHEEDVRSRLTDHRDQGLALSEWKRAFYLSPNLNPTRQNLIDVAYIHGTIGSEWYFPRGPHASLEAVASNRAVVESFLGTLNMVPDNGHAERTANQKHEVATGVSLRTAFDDMLTRLTVVRMNDSLRFYAVLMQVRAWLDEHPDATCSIYRMSPGEQRERSVNASDEMRTLQQGPQVRGGVTIYPGDGAVRAANGMTMQIHTLTMKNASGVVIANDVPVVAIWVPGEFSQAFFVQDQA